MESEELIVGVPSSAALAARMIEHVAQTFDLRFEVNRSVANKEAVIVRDQGILYFADGGVVIIAYNVVAQNAAAGNHAISDVGAFQCSRHCRAVAAPR